MITVAGLSNYIYILDIHHTNILNQTRHVKNISCKHVYRYKHVYKKNPVTNNIYYFQTYIYIPIYIYISTMIAQNDIDISYFRPLLQTHFNMCK